MSNLLDNGIKAAKSGDKTRAKQYVAQALQENPQNIAAWLWMSTLVDEIKQKKFCYQKVLALNPQNEHALKGMSQLGAYQDKPFIETVSDSQQSLAGQTVSSSQRAKFEYIETIETTYRPSWDLYEPHMPSVDLHANMDEFFEDVRTLGTKSSKKGFKDEFYRKHPEYTDRVLWVEPVKEGEAFIPVITPGRMIVLIPAFFHPETKSSGAQNVGDYVLPSRKNLKITAISHTYMDDFLNNNLSVKEKLTSVIKSIPFIAQIAAFAGVDGHSVLIFEGHPSAFEAGINNSDVLFIDSGMLKFLQDDWSEIAFRCMNPHCKIFIHEREGYRLRSVIKTKTHPGWDYGFGVGNEDNYINMLFGASSELGGKHIRLATGKRLPDLSQFFTNKPETLEFLSKIPFDYELLDTQKVIKLIIEKSEKKFLSSTRTHKIRYQETDTRRIIETSFSIKTAEDKNGNIVLDIWLD
jgi:hypothetical protein